MKFQIHTLKLKAAIWTLEKVRKIIKNKAKQISVNELKKFGLRQ